LIINSRADKYIDDEGKDIGGTRLADSPKTSQVEVEGASEAGDMILEGKVAIKCGIQVTDGG